MPNRSPDEIVAEIDRKQNEEDLDLPRRAGEAISNAASKAKDFLVDTVKNMPEVKTIRAVKNRYELPMEKKAKGGKIRSASSRADGCCIRGKTRA